jgi:hypothetical protein
MIIELTKENLQNCGFDNENIDRLIECDNYVSFLFKGTCYYANNIEKKIYTEIDGFRKYYLENGTISFPMDCPDLIPNYFDLALKNYLDKQILLLNTMFVESDQKEKFVLNEIEKIKRRIEVLKKDLKIKIYLINENNKKQIDILDSYLNFLKNKLDEQPQQIKIAIPNNIKPNLRNDIFEGNAIELFKYYYDCKAMVNNNRVHFRFLFEVMKKDGFIHDTVSLGQYIKFITKDFGYVDTELKSIDLNSSPNKQNLKDYSRYKEDLKTTLK